MPRRRQQMTLVEWLIVVAIAGILIAIAAPAMQQAKRQARLRQAQGADARGMPQAAGQSNTIGVPEASSGSPTQEGQPPRRGPRGGGVMWLAALVAAAVIVRLLSKRARRQAGRRRRHPHENT